jgi:hypothetical protein
MGRVKLRKFRTELPLCTSPKAPSQTRPAPKKSNTPSAFHESDRPVGNLAQLNLAHSLLSTLQWSLNVFCHVAIYSRYAHLQGLTRVSAVV